MKNSGIFIGICLILIIAAVVIPLPAQLVNYSIMATIGFAIIFLLVALFTKKPLTLPWFPSILLAFTTFKVALSVSVIRLILLNGDAGEVIGVFGHFIGAGNLIIGLIIFVAITAVSFIAIIKVAKRVSGITASFTSNALTGTDSTNAPHSKTQVETAFCGAMDGVVQYVKGDTIFNIMALFIIVIGSVAIGVNPYSLLHGEAVAVFMLLAIGHGIAFLIPNVFISFASSLITIRVYGDIKE